jgi:hypothetical protein
MTPSDVSLYADSIYLWLINGLIIFAGTCVAYIVRGQQKQLENLQHDFKRMNEKLCREYPTKAELEVVKKDILDYMKAMETNITNSITVGILKATIDDLKHK